jgi:hypothetical protein
MSDHVVDKVAAGTSAAPDGSAVESAPDDSVDKVTYRAIRVTPGPDAYSLDLLPEDLPDIQDHEAEDLDQRLDAVLDRLAQLGRDALLRYALEVGQLLVNNFFDGSIESYYDRNSHKHNSFNALLERRERELAALGLSGTTLRSYIRVWDAWRVMPHAIREDLQLSQIRVLTSLHDPGLRHELAAVAVERGWTVRELAAAVAEEREGQSPDLARHRGRRRAADKTLRQVIAQTRKMAKWRDVYRTNVSSLRPMQRERLRHELEAAIAELEAVRTSLNGDVVSDGEGDA